LNLRTAIDSNYIIVVNLSKGTTGHTPSSIFGSLLASSIKTALMAREDVPEEERPPLAFYADEFHNYGTIAWAEMLSECRKYGLQLVLAHQFTSQLHNDVLGAVLGNVDTLIVFRVGVADAKLLAPALETGEMLYDRDRLAYVHPDAIPPHKLMNQSRFQACMRRGTEHFFIDTAPPFPSRNRYDSNLASSDRRFAPQAYASTARRTSSFAKPGRAAARRWRAASHYDYRGGRARTRRSWRSLRQNGPM
jgi:hypothetical protein